MSKIQDTRLLSLTQFKPSVILASLSKFVKDFYCGGKLDCWLCDARDICLSDISAGGRAILLIIEACLLELASDKIEEECSLLVGRDEDLPHAISFGDSFLKLKLSKCII